MVFHMAIDGSALRLLRERSGYSATQFAEKLGISLTYLGDIEAGRRTLKRNPDLIRRFADELQVPFTMLMKAAPGEVAV